jgi:hypothetical protein
MKIIEKIIIIVHIAVLLWVWQKGILSTIIAELSQDFQAISEALKFLTSF